MFKYCNGLLKMEQTVSRQANVCCCCRSLFVCFTCTGLNVLTGCFCNTQLKLSKVEVDEQLQCKSRSKDKRESVRLQIL